MLPNARALKLHILQSKAKIYINMRDPGKIENQVGKISLESFVSSEKLLIFPPKIEFFEGIFVSKIFF